MYNSLLMGLKNVIATLENSLMFSYKTEHSFTIQSSSCTLRYSLKSNENVFPQENPCAKSVAALFKITKKKKEPR